ncbi:hypothetical protein AgCh_016312 [Apium graveolens]
MRQPPGYIDRRFPDYICKLIKSIYDLKQASRTWYQRLSSYLLEIGFISSEADSSLCILNGHSGIAYVLVYVDDIIVTASTTEMVSYIIQKLQDEFVIKDLGPLFYFLEIEVVREDTVLIDDQPMDIVYSLVVISFHEVLVTRSRYPSGAHWVNPTGSHNSLQTK